MRRPFPRPLSAALRLIACAVLACCGTACGDKPKAPKAPVGSLTDYGPNPQGLAVEGAPANVTPPAGEWRVMRGVSADSQTFEQFRRPEEGTVLRVLVFPVQQQRSPAAVLPRAVDRFVRSLGTEGFGRSQAGTEHVLGAPVAWMDFAAMIRGKKVQGHARLLLADRSTWVLAIGCAPEDAPEATRETVRHSIASLVPSEVTWYERSFQAAYDLDRVVARVGDETPVTLGDIMAVELFVEAGLGIRYPLAVRDVLHAALTEEAQTASAEGRASFHGYREALIKAREMPADEREAGLEAQGRKIFQAILQRVPEMHAPAAKIHTVWKRMKQRAVGTDKDALSVAAVQNLVEMSAFLASLAADREVKPSQDLVDAVQKDLQGRYGKLRPEDREALAHTGRTWAALRYAWDHASRGAKQRLRRAAVETLAPEAQREEVRKLAGAAALMEWMHAHGDEEARAYALAAARLPSAELEVLIDVLGVEDAFGHHLGW